MLSNSLKCSRILVFCAFVRRHNFPAHYEKENNETIKIYKLKTDTANIVNQLVTAGVNVREIYYNRLTLEEYYLNITGGNNNA